MKIASLSGSPREGVGKKDATALRDKHRVPGVLYGKGEQHHFHVDEIKLSKLVISPDVYRVKLELDGTEHDCIFQEVQFHPVTDRIVHIDLLELSEDKPVRVELPLRTTGTAAGVIAGGRLELQFRRVPVRGLPNDLPEFVSIDVSDLEIGDNARVRDMNVENCEVLMSDSALIAAVKRTRAAMSAAAGEEGAEGAEDAAQAEAGAEA